MGLALGVSARLANMPGALERLRPTGAPYLLWQGALINVLNPQVALFFLAFIPRFVDPAGGPAVAQLVLLGRLFDLSAPIVNVIVALAAATISARAARQPREDHRPRAFECISGVALPGFGLHMLLGRGP